MARPLCVGRASCPNREAKLETVRMPFTASLSESMRSGIEDLAAEIFRHEREDHGRVDPLALVLREKPRGRTLAELRRVRIA
jgi:hypothetical protein